MSVAENQKYRVPRDVDAPLPIFFWEATEVVAAIAMLGMGIVLNFFLLGFVVAVFILWAAPQLRRGAKRGQVQHYLWSLGADGFDPNLKRLFPPARVPEYLE